MSRDRTQWEFHQTADGKRFLNRLNNPWIRKREEALFALLSPCGGRTLEVGCGEGNNHYYISRADPGVRYVGMDFSYKKVAFAARADAEGAYLTGDATALPFQSGVFDAVLARDVLHHVNDHREAIIEECLRTLAPGGRLWVVEGNGNKIINRIFWMLVPEERGMRDSTPEKFEAMCRRLGCDEIIHTEPFYLVRAAGFFLGWREGAAGRLINVIYMMIDFVEKAISPLSRPGNGSCMIARWTR